MPLDPQPPYLLPPGEGERQGSAVKLMLSAEERQGLMDLGYSRDEVVPGGHGNGHGGTAALGGAELWR